MKIIYISGIDGCGKTTQSKRLVSWINGLGQVTEYQWLRWQPSVRILIKEIRKFIQSWIIERSVGPQTNLEIEESGQKEWNRMKKWILSTSLVRWMWLEYATRDYFRAYRKASKDWQFDYVVLDRYIFDFIVDQSINFGQSVPAICAAIQKTPICEMRQPDLLVYIDIPSELGYKRKLDGTPLSYLKDRESYYLDVPVSDNTLHVDGTQSEEQIHEQICAWVKPRLELRK